MPRKTGRYPLTVLMTSEQRDALTELADGEGISGYVRGLLAKDAAARGIDWPDNLPSANIGDRPEDRRRSTP